MRPGFVGVLRINFYHGQESLPKYCTILYKLVAKTLRCIYTIFMYLLYLPKGAEPANILSSSHYPAWLYVVLHKHTLRKPFPQTICGVTRDWCPKVKNEQDSHQGSLLTDSQAPWLRTNQSLLQSQTVCYHSPIYTGWHKLQGITLFDTPFLLCAFLFQTLPSPGGSDWATRFTLSAQNAHQHLRQLCINTAMVILLFQLKLPSSLS